MDHIEKIKCLDTDFIFVIGLSQLVSKEIINSAREYAEDVHKKVYESLKSSIRTKMRDLLDCKLKSQNHEKARYLFIRRPEDGIIDWNDDIEDIHRLIRAISRPYAGAFTYYNYSLES